ncbi:uncharacterized protein V1513DRAFT_472458, partial [Lipomyces chichibuensis]|uniref:uncharacterized protein n=1 Tax=Lipomyces chichibuensis TaxID=1546026 RepID=UPI00334428F8
MSEEDAPRLFSSAHLLEDLGRENCSQPLRSAKDLETFERLAVENNVRAVIAELCKIPDAREEFKLEDGVQFDNHPSALADAEFDRPDVDDQSIANTNTLITTGEYKPPHKLSVENLRTGLRPMDFYEKVVQTVKVPTNKDERLRYNAEQLTGSALAQQYNVMI